MKRFLKIIFSIILPVICISAICISFIPVKNSVDDKNQQMQNPTRFQANYYALAYERSPAQGQPTCYKGGSVFLEPDSTFIMCGGRIQNHSNTYGGAIFISEGATFTMEGGTITGCSATYGGAIYVSSGGTCNIIDGTITGNTANYGPSIYAEAGAIVNISPDSNIDENSVELNISVTISTDTIAVGHPNAGFNLHYVDFGSYPQWYVGDDFNNELENWYNLNTPTEVNTYVVRTRTWRAYEYTDGNIYVRGNNYVNDNDNTSTYMSGETLGSTSTTEYSWFKLEPIRWVVLNYENYTSGTDSNLEVMSLYVLASNIQYLASTVDPDNVKGTADDPNHWKVTNIRGWLNDSFYNTAFSSDEKKVIHLSTIGNNITGNYDKSTSNTAGVATDDYVYLMSYWDFYNTEGLFTNTILKRYCSPTDFAIVNYCFCYSSTTTLNGRTCDYWLRSAGSDALGGTGVSREGRFTGVSSGTQPSLGIRPVLQLCI